jgi:Fe-S cluster assembly protein SufD
MSSASVDPQLEIMSDEVKAGHGASVSRIDENQIEYLMSRGIEREDAEEQIVEGWLSDRMWV